MRTGGVFAARRGRLGGECPGRHGCSGWADTLRDSSLRSLHDRGQPKHCLGDRRAGRSEVQPRVGQPRVAVEDAPHLTGVRHIEGCAHVDPADPRPDRGLEAVPGHPGRAMKDERQRNAGSDPREQLEVETGSPSTPVLATNAHASSGSVRAPEACAPPFPPISPSSASTHRPARCAVTVRFVVSRTFSSYGRRAASIITDVTPSRSATLVPYAVRAASWKWSRWSATGTDAVSASSRPAARSARIWSPWKWIAFSLTYRIPGVPTGSPVCDGVTTTQTLGEPS